MPATEGRSRQRTPPSCVVQRALPPKAKPSSASANRISFTPDRELTFRGAPGAGTAFQWTPPSVVRSTDVHCPDRHGAVPRTHPCRGDVKVTLAARKRRTTNSPDGGG